MGNSRKPTIHDIETAIQKKRKELSRSLVSENVISHQNNNKLNEDEKQDHHFKKLELASMNNALEAIQKYKDKKIDIEDLHTAMSGYLTQTEKAEKTFMPQKMSMKNVFSRFFSSPPTTKNILAKALKDIVHISKAIKHENIKLRR